MSIDSSTNEYIDLIGRLKEVPTILQVVARTTGLRFVAIARVTDASWTACAVYDLINFGLRPGGELVLESTICNEIRQHRQPVVFGHASNHPEFAHHPTPKLYGFESYISVPIFRANGEFFGTLCALDPEPVNLDDPNIVSTLQLFTQLIAAGLETEERMAQSASALLDAQQTVQLRDQFIAVLGHDLRNPLTAITVGASLLQLTADARSQRTIGHIQRSCARMVELIDDILDFARGKLGGGIPAVLRTDDDLAAVLQYAVDEVRQAHPDRAIEVDIAIPGPVMGDPRRIAQLLVNLLVNGLTHGADDQPVRISARDDAGAFELSVTNQGEPIPSDKMARLFQPFSRGADTASHAGLGLGLYIAAEIAKAHGGSLEVTSSREAGTCFAFHMPAPRSLPNGSSDTGKSATQRNSAA